MPAGARLTMVTELKLERLPLLVIVTWLLVAILVAAGLGVAVKREARQ